MRISLVLTIAGIFTRKDKLDGPILAQSSEDMIRWASMRIEAVYPTLEHERAAQAVVDFFSARADTDAVILMGSCARQGRADSCLDFLILLLPEVFLQAKDAIAREWKEFYTSAETFRALQQVGKYSHVDLDLIDGRFVPKP